jgi:hypothetical protein
MKYRYEIADRIARGTARRETGSGHRQTSAAGNATPERVRQPRDGSRETGVRR